MYEKFWLSCYFIVLLHPLCLSQPKSHISVGICRRGNIPDVMDFIEKTYHDKIVKCCDISTQTQIKQEYKNDLKRIQELIKPHDDATKTRYTLTCKMNNVIVGALFCHIYHPTKVNNHTGRGFLGPLYIDEQHNRQEISSLLKSFAQLDFNARRIQNVEEYK